jgi:hypothetical protein
MQKRDLAARITGLIVFALGIVALIFSFYVAYHQLFVSPTAGIVTAPAKPGSPSAISTLSSSALAVLIKLAAMFVMILAGSLIASRGIQMYFAAAPAIAEAVSRDPRNTKAVTNE